MSACGVGGSASRGSLGGDALFPIRSPPAGKQNFRTLSFNCFFFLLLPRFFQRHFWEKEATTVDVAPFLSGCVGCGTRIIECGGCLIVGSSGGTKK